MIVKNIKLTKFSIVIARTIVEASLEHSSQSGEVKIIKAKTVFAQILTYLNNPSDYLKTSAPISISFFMHTKRKAFLNIMTVLHS